MSRPDEQCFIFICYFDLEDGVEPGEHVLELLLLLVGEGGDHGLHLARLEVGHLEHVLHQQLRVDQPRPREQVDEPENGKHNTTCLNEPEIEAAFDFFRSSVC